MARRKQPAVDPVETINGYHPHARHLPPPLPPLLFFSGTAHIPDTILQSVPNTLNAVAESKGFSHHG